VSELIVSHTLNIPLVQKEHIIAFHTKLQQITNSLCYASWVWTGYDPFKIIPSRYIILKLFIFTINNAITTL